MSDEQNVNLEAKLIARAWQDDAFRQALVNDPKATIEREFGTRIPEGVNVHVHEQSENSLHLVVPQPPEGELSVEELERVAGGVVKVFDKSAPILAQFQATQRDSDGTADGQFTGHNPKN